MAFLSWFECGSSENADGDGSNEKHVMTVVVKDGGGGWDGNGRVGVNCNLSTNLYQGDCHNRSMVTSL